MPTEERPEPGRKPSPIYDVYPAIRHSHNAHNAHNTPVPATAPLFTPPTTHANEQVSASHTARNETDQAALPGFASAPLAPVNGQAGQSASAGQNPAPAPIAIQSPAPRAAERDEADAARDTAIWTRVPADQRTILRLYLRENKDSDQERARELCTQYGIAYEAAKAGV